MGDIKTDRTLHLLELLKDSHKIKFTINKDLIVNDGIFKEHVNKNQKHLDYLLEDDSVRVDVIRVLNDIKIYVEIKK